MIKEYKWIGNTYMTNLMIDVNKDACKGWRLVNIVHNGGYFAAVLEREKILDGEKMSKEYECFRYKDMMQLMNAIKAYDYDGWQLVSVGHNGKFYFAVVQRDKIEIEESEEK